MARDILVIVPDLFFASRIREVAKATGAALRETAPAGAAAAAAEHAPDLAIIDLHGAPDIAELIRALRAAAPDTAIIGFHSHVDAEIAAAATAAGASRVLPRSAFTRRLPELLGPG